MRTRANTHTLVLVLAAGTLAAGCGDYLNPTAPEGDDGTGATAPALAASSTHVPAPLVTVAAGPESLTFWPFTGADLVGTPRDPINLIFPAADARHLRSWLLGLSGDRTGAPFPLDAFDCTWSDAMGAHQTAYGEAMGWEGSAVQLECGAYQGIRFHVRLFQLGEWVVGGAHFEVQIPGTNEHEVLSWELAEALVAADLVRAGALTAAPGLTDAITPAPAYRAINPLVYNGLPAALKALAGGPDVATDPVPLGNDGRARLLAVAGADPSGPAVHQDAFTLDFDQTIPKPFCMQGPLDWLVVKGPIEFRQQVVESASGALVSHFRARGALTLTPINPLTGAMGDPLEARVNEQHRSVATDRLTRVSSLRLQLILPGNRPESGRLFATLSVGPGGSDHGTLAVSCGS